MGNQQATLNDHFNESTTSRKGKLFISYSWEYRKDTVYKMANYLEKEAGYDVWVDINHLGDGPGIFKAMVQGIENAHIVLCFFSEAYAKSKNCMLDMEYATKENKEIVQIQVQTNYKPEGMWSLVFKDNHWIDYSDDSLFERASKDILAQIESIMGFTKTDTRQLIDENPFSQSAKSFEVFGAPVFSSIYFGRRKLEDTIRYKLKQVANKFAGEGMVVIYGDGGIGKSTLMAWLLNDSEHRRFFVEDCEINRVIWINCFEWTDKFNEEQFYGTISRLAEENEKDLHFETDESATKRFSVVMEYYKTKELRCVFVFDDVFNIDVINSFIEQYGSDPGPVFVVLTRDASRIKTSKFPIPVEIRKIEQIPDELITDMLESTFGLQLKALTCDEVLELSEICCGLPLIANLIASTVKDDPRSNKEDVCRELIAKRNEIKEMIVRGVDKGKPYITVFNLLSLSLSQMDSSDRMFYYAFLVFNPGKQVTLEHLQVLWGLSNPRIVRLCRLFVDRSLLRRVNPRDKWDEAILSVHQLLFETAAEIAAKDLGLPDDLNDEDMLCKIRYMVITGQANRRALQFLSNDLERETHRDWRDSTGLAIWVDSVQYKKDIDIAKQFIKAVSVEDMVEFARKRSANMTDDQPFLNFIHQKAPWLTKPILEKITKHEDTDLIWSAISELGPVKPDDNLGIARCFINDFFHGDVNDSSYREGISRLVAEWRDKSRAYIEDQFQRDSTDPLIQEVIEENQDFVRIKLFLQTHPEYTRDKLVMAAWVFRIASLKGYNTIAKEIVDGCPLIKEHFSYENKNDCLYTPATIAAQNDQVDVLKLFADNVNITDLYYAKGGAKIYLEELLSEIRQADEEKYEKRLIFNLESSVKGSQIKIFQHLIDSYPDIAFRWIYDQASKAMKERNDNNLEFFSKKLKSLDEKQRLLKEAIDLNILSSVDYLVDSFRKESLDLKGFSPLMYAASKGRLEIVKSLLEKAPHFFNLINKIGWELLDTASSHGYLQMVMYLLEKEPKLANVTNEDGWTALHIAACEGHFGIVKFLCEKHPVLLTVSNENGVTSLDVAANRGHSQIVKYCEQIQNQGVIEVTNETKDNIVEENKLKIFASYSWSSRKQAVEKMADYLQDNAGHQVWIDKKSMTNRPNTIDAMTEGINNAQVMLCFFSDAYAKSDACQKEIEFAHSKKKLIIPIRVEQDYEPADRLLFIFRANLRIDYFSDDQFEGAATAICKTLNQMISNSNE